MGERLRVTAFSTALYSTWIFVEDFRLLLDAGDGVCAQLLGKVRKIHKVAVTHADRDHITGLLQLQQLNAHEQPLEIFYPVGSGSFPALAEFCRRFDPWSGPKVTWTPVANGPCCELAPNLRLKAIENSHVPGEGLIRSVGYQVIRETRKLKPEHLGKPAEALASIRREAGEGALTDPCEEIALSYSGDTGVCEPEIWRESEVLIHEATFLRHKDMEKGPDRANQHSVLPDVLEMAAVANPGRLVLSHFSSRYGADQIRADVQDHARRLDLPFPIHIVPPGVVVVDLLSQPAVWPAKPICESRTNAS